MAVWPPSGGHRISLAMLDLPNVSICEAGS
jgi:hypothetical protein